MRRFEDLKIAVAGLGYVGLSAAVLLAQRHEVTAVDLLPEKIAAINARRSPIRDEIMERLLAEETLRLRATPDAEQAYADADFVVICVPTDYSAQKGAFDTGAVESVIEQVLGASESAVMVIRSTIPVGYTRRMREKYGTDRILFSPEFLRESSAMYDSLHPSRIIVGCDGGCREAAETFARLLREGVEGGDAQTLFMGFEEAEAVKLFSNAYLALRVAYFNELDTYAEAKGLNARDMIRGVCADPRIGDYYNNPSFGYGGYCLPKDTRQLLADYRDVPQELIAAVVESNETRKRFVAGEILKKAGSGDGAVVGIYRVTAKAESDGTRQSSVQDVMALLRARGAELVVYEPQLPAGTEYLGARVIDDLEEFKRICGCIVANRVDAELADAAEKIYTRDLFHRD